MERKKERGEENASTILGGGARTPTTFPKKVKKEGIKRENEKGAVRHSKYSAEKRREGKMVKWDGETVGQK